MQIITNQNKLLTAVRMVERVVAKNVTLPILNTILLRTKKGQLHLSATNLELGITCWIGAKIDQDGEVAVPARVFSDFIGNIQDEKVSLTVAKNILHINSEHYKTQILCMKTDEFPIIPTVSKGKQISIPGTELKKALLGVYEAASVSETRPELSGVFVSVHSNGIDFAATDSFRLAEQRIEGDYHEQVDFILPRQSVAEFMRLSEYSPEEVVLVVGDNQIMLRGAEFELVSRLIDGRYPDYKKIIPDKYASLITVDKAELERHIRMASVFSSSISDLKLKTTNAGVHIGAKNSDRGEISATLPGVLVNQPFEVALNYRYLLDGLKTIPGNRVQIWYTGEGSPIVVKGEDTSQQTYLIMPLRN